MKKPTWYERGYDEALQGLPYDPPANPASISHLNYTSGYRDGLKQADANEYNDAEYGA